MRKTACVLSALLVLANGTLLDQVSDWIEKKPQHSSLVPFWRNSEADEFVCTKSGYHADSGNCKYFYECMSLIPGHFNRLVYKCNGDRLYSIEKGDCVPADETGRPECREGSSTVGPEGENDSRGPGNLLLGGEANLPALEIAGKIVQSVQTSMPTPRRVEPVPAPTGHLPVLVPRVQETTAASEETTGRPGTAETTDSREQETTASDPPLSPEGNSSFGLDASNENGPGCRAEGFFGDPEDCSKFFRCVPYGSEWTRYDFSCPRGTIWDDRLKTCNFRAATKWIACKDRTALQLSSARTILVCPTSIRRHPKYCNVFYQCTISENLQVNVTSLACPENTIFDEGKLRCVETQATRGRSCSMFQVARKPGNLRILEVPDGKICPAEGSFPYAQNCSSTYIRCKIDDSGSLRGYLRECPAGQLYSPGPSRCMSSVFLPLCAELQNTGNRH